MKKAMTRFLVLFFVALNVAPQVHAQAFKAVLFDGEEDGIVKVIAQRDGQSFDLVYQVSNETKVKVNIVSDAQNRVVFSETFRNRDEFRRPYNLSQLPAGDYTFEVTGKHGTYTQRVSVL